MDMSEYLYDRLEEESLLDKGTFEDILSLIQGQIDNPFISNEDNLEILLTKIENKDFQADVCRRVLASILDENTYMKIAIDDIDDIVSATRAIYRFFIKNRAKISYIFIREFLMKGKTRRMAIDDIKCGTGYNRNYHGKKEYYILLTKIHKVVRNIKDINVDFDKFLKYLLKDYNRAYIRVIEDLHMNGLLSFNDFGRKYMKAFVESDNVDSIYNRLRQDITSLLIGPEVKDMDKELVMSQEIEDDDDTETQEYRDMTT